MANIIDVEVKAKNSGLDKVEADARKAGTKVARELDDGFDKAAKSAEGATKKIGADLDKTAQKAAEAGQEAGVGFGEALKTGLGAIGKLPGIAGAGAAIGGALLAGMQSEWEEDRVGAMINAQTGGTAGAADRLGDLAGDVFSSSFGSSIENAGQALTAIFQNKIFDTSAAEADIERMATKVITVGDIMGEEFNSVARSAQQAVRTGLAESVTEALDMITHAQQEGLNNSGELLDTIDEYGTSFREVGLDGAEAFGLLSQAQEGGARNIDLAADAIKEFGILAQDTASNASRGFQAIGLDGERMGRMIAAGGEPARQALEQTLNALRAMPPGIERNSAAVDLFGTKAEDLGDALFSMDLDTATEQFGDFAGSVEEAARAMAEGQSAWDKMGKNISNATNSLGEFIEGFSDWGASDEFEQATTKAQEFRTALAQFADTGATDFLDQLKEKYPEYADAIDDVIEKNKANIDVTEEAADANVDYAGTFDDVIEATRAMADGHISLSEASIASMEALADALEAAEEFAGKGLNATKTGFDLNTEAGRELEGSLNDIASSTWDVVEAMREEGKSTQETEGYIRSQRGELIRAARQMGLSRDAAIAYANRLLAIPKTVKTDAEFRAAQARTALDSVMNRIRNIPRSVRTDYYLYTHTLQGGGGSVRDYSSSYTGGGGRAHGGVVGTAATGGARHSSTVINEAGPELVKLPSGSMVATAGATRAMGEAGWLGGGGGGGSLVVRLESGPGADGLTGSFIAELVRRKILRLVVEDREKRTLQVMPG